MGSEGSTRGGSTWSLDERVAATLQLQIGIPIPIVLRTRQGSGMVESVLNSVVNSEACARTGPQADAAEAQALVDQFGRVHTSLRISVTDRCPLRCVYCLPPQGVTWLPTTSILSAAEIERIAAVCAAAGVTVFRLTGGEPLMRGDIVEIVARLARLRTPAGDPVEVTMTTSGIGLEALHDDLVAAGLDRINISLDTLRPQRFLELTRRDRLDEVLRGIGVAARGPLHPPKLNAVVMRGINDDELIDLTEFAIDLGAQMRFIEQMPLDAGRTWQRDRMVTCQEILGTLAGHWKLTPMPGRDHAPAESFLLDGGPATVGV
ncbi:MAG: radical SAM protein, partial [Micrococcales bacterium]|nr:radical SAM protein [Micrococcales bacterium]